MDNLESQENEIMALKYIYEEKDFIVDALNPPCGRFLANVRLPENFLVIAKRSELQAIQLIKENSEEVLNMEYLPPINLFFRFPESYPEDTCPAFLLSCNWLTLMQLTNLCKQLESLWLVNKDAILYTWFQFLQDEALQFLKIDQCLDITELLNFKVKDNFRDRELNNKDVVENNKAELQSNSSRTPITPSVDGGCGVVDLRAFNDLSDGKLLIPILKDFNEFKKEDAFKHSSHDCDICILRKNGSDFVTFKPCKHSFCKECIKEYFEQLIRDGNVNSLNCLDSECSTQAAPAIIKELVCSELFEKYDKLLLSRTLEGMADIGYCPRQECQCPVIIDTCGRMGTCPACSFVFCPFCKMAYHGVAPCNFKSVERQKIFQDYVNGTSSEKERIEKLYGKRQIKSLIEDTLSETWKDSNSKNCPRCQSSIEKSDGCNKMTCYRCGTFFCWLCMKQLEYGNPYMHYDDRRSSCFSRLFPEDYMDDFFEVEAGEFLDRFEIL